MVRRKVWTHGRKYFDLFLNDLGYITLPWKRPSCLLWQCWWEPIRNVHWNTSVLIYVWQYHQLSGMLDSEKIWIPNSQFWSDGNLASADFFVWGSSFKPSIYWEYVPCARGTGLVSQHRLVSRIWNIWPTLIRNHRRMLRWALVSGPTRWHKVQKNNHT